MRASGNISIMKCVFWAQIMFMVKSPFKFIIMKQNYELVVIMMKQYNIVSTFVGPNNACDHLIFVTTKI